jgi:hypothetical protein
MPRRGEPAWSDDEVFVPGPRFLSGKLRFVHCFRQVPPGANSRLFSAASKPELAEAA